MGFERSMLRIASIGECMVELSESAEAGAPAAGRMQRTFGGDTLNTAVYLARCLRQSAAQPPATVPPAAVHPAAVHYVTALGDDPFRAELLPPGHAQGIEPPLQV